MLVGEDIFKDTNDEFSSGGSSTPRIQPSAKAPMIEKIFKEVLGRKPSSRESAYYKYGVMKEDDIRLKLIKSDEHKKILKDATKLPNVKVELKDVRISEKKLLQKLEDINLEIGESEKLLKEKNSVIQDLREKVKNPYDLPTQVEKYEEGYDVFSSIRPKIVPSRNTEKRTFKKVLIDLIDILFK